VRRPKTLSRTLRLGGTGLVAAGLIAGAAGIANAQLQDAPTERAAVSAAPAVPETLVPPAGNVLLGTLKARGVQIYQCTAGAWTFLEPAASLTGLIGGSRHSVIHFRGPSWESVEDGSLVEAKAVANSPVTGSIPQLLLQASVNRGTGVLGEVTYIQRLATTGGVAPTSACTDGETSGVAYRADYSFYVAG